MLLLHRQCVCSGSGLDYQFSAHKINTDLPNPLCVITRHDQKYLLISSTFAFHNDSAPHINRSIKFNVICSPFHTEVVPYLLYDTNVHLQRGHNATPLCHFRYKAGFPPLRGGTCNGLTRQQQSVQRPCCVPDDLVLQ